MSLSDLVLPTTVINNYLWDTMKTIEPSLATTYGKVVPFFPLGDSASGDASWVNRAYVLYDRMMRTTNDPFYLIKKDNILYGVKGTDIQVLQWSAAIQYILDRQDDSAQDANAWNSQQANPANVYFHSLRAYQTDRANARDWSSRSYYISEFIIDIKYHLTTPEEIPQGLSQVNKLILP
jgi:hypothetical protein